MEINKGIDPNYTPKFKHNINKPYSFENYQEAKKQGLNLEDWNDYKNFFMLEEFAEEMKQWHTN